MEPFAMKFNHPYAWANSMGVFDSFCFLQCDSKGAVWRMEAWQSDTPWNCMGWEAAPMGIHEEAAKR